MKGFWLTPCKTYYRLSCMATPYTTYQQFSAASRHRYHCELKDTIAECLRHDAVMPLRRHVRKWFARGAPIDPQGAGAPTPTLRIVLRQMALALPSLSEYHADCRLWLRYPECRARTDAEREKLRQDLARFATVKPYAENWIPWNWMLYAPTDTPYHAFNKLGVEVTVGAAPQFPDEAPTT